MMQKVLISLVPIVLLAAYLFGLRILVMLAVVSLAGCLVEYGAMRLISGAKARISEAALVSCVLFVLTLPPATPYWVAVLGISFGLFFGKGVFGGFGRNVFNPALVGRCFVYISFPAYLTGRWTMPFSGLAGGLFSYDGGVDAISTATPLIAQQAGEKTAGYLELLLGTTGGSWGETSAVLIILAAIYLIVTKTASWKIMLSGTLAFTVFSSVLYFIGASSADPLFALLSGGFLFAVVFMATDPISAPGQDKAKIIYACLIGLITVFIRQYSLFTEGAMFAILVGNIFAPLIDRQIRQLVARKKVAA